MPNHVDAIARMPPGSFGTPLYPTTPGETGYSPYSTNMFFGGHVLPPQSVSSPIMTTAAVKQQQQQQQQQQPSHADTHAAVIQQQLLQQQQQYVAQQQEIQRLQQQLQLNALRVQQQQQQQHQQQQQESQVPQSAAQQQAFAFKAPRQQHVPVQIKTEPLEAAVEDKDDDDYDDDDDDYSNPTPTRLQAKKAASRKRANSDRASGIPGRAARGSQSVGHGATRAIPSTQNAISEKATPASSADAGGSSDILLLAEQPAQFGRFRYQAEGRQSSIEGRHPGSFPTVVVNPRFASIVPEGTKIQASLVLRHSDTLGNYQPHWHVLTTKDGSDPAQAMHNGRCIFRNLVVQRQKTDTKHNVADQRAVRIMFYTVVPFAGEMRTVSVITDPIFNADLKIDRLSHCTSPSVGGVSVFILCSKVDIIICHYACHPSTPSIRSRKRPSECASARAATVTLSRRHRTGKWIQIRAHKQS